METLYAEWGKRVSKTRNEKGLTQDRLAELTGTTQSGISRFEAGEFSPTDEFRMRLASALDTSVYELFPYPSKEEVDA